MGASHKGDTAESNGQKELHPFWAAEGKREDETVMRGDAGETGRG